MITKRVFIAWALLLRSACETAAPHRTFQMFLGRVAPVTENTFDGI
jgi:hypothetical protein